MRLGKIKILTIFFFIIPLSNLIAEDRILSAPIINLENLEPSYEDLDIEKDTSLNSNNQIKKRDIIDKKKDNIKFVNLMGLDKITAKTIPIKIKLGETAKFGLLEIKALKCGFTKSKSTSIDSVAYLQVRDISENQNEKVFIFNGWTFASSPSLAPIDHAIYDIWLVGCENT